MNYLSYGLDFGTTNSAISVLDADGKARVLPITQKGEQVIKSVLFFPNKSKKIYIGQEAIERYVTSKMKGRLIQSVKSALTDEKFTGTVINAEKWQIEDLIAHIISFLKERADELIGQEVNRVVLGRPAIFSNDPKKEQLARERLALAAQKAGFKEINFQLEPIAAAFHYEITLKQPETVLIADLGGGTSDFTLMKLSPDRTKLTKRDSDILATNGVYTGGDNLDARIMWRKIVKHFGAEAHYRSGNNLLHVPHRIVGSICDWRRLSFLRDDRVEQELIRMLLRSADDHEAIARLQSLIDNNLGFSLAQSVEAAKCRLSTDKQTAISFSEEDIRINETITRDEFEDSIQNELEKIRGCLDDLLSSSGLTASDINTVFLTGGTSYVPAMKKLFEEEIGISKVVLGDAFVSVAAGLALSSKLFFR